MTTDHSRLIPELMDWSSGRGISLEDWIGCVGRFDHAIGYASLFWPDFVEHRGCVLFAPVDPEVFGAWWTRTKGDVHQIESVMNHRHVLDLFCAGEGREPTRGQVLHLGGVLREMWECKLRRDFPDRDFVVTLQEGSPEDLPSCILSVTQALLPAHR